MPGIDLNTLFQSDPAAQELGLKLIGDERAAQSQGLARIAQQMEMEKQMQPLRMRQMELGNQTTEAQLPNLRALSSMNEDKATMSRKTLNPAIEGWLSENRGKISSQQLKELTDTGNAYVQAGKMLAPLPGVASHSAAREILGNFYRPEFDKVPPEDLGKTLNYIGQGMVDAQTAYQQKLGIEGAKSEAKRQLEQERTEGRRSLEEFKGRLRSNLESQKQSAKADPKTARAMANQLFLAAQQEQDPDKRAELLSQANSFNEIAFAELDRRAQAAAATKPDLGKLGVETNPPPPTPQLPGATPKPSVENEMTLDKVKKMYPGIPEDKLKEAFKKKFGMELK